jgi:hypothetical protein
VALSHSAFALLSGVYHPLQVVHLIPELLYQLGLRFGCWFAPARMRYTLYSHAAILDHSERSGKRLAVP